MTSPLGFDASPVEVPAAYEHVVKRLRMAIWLGELTEGERLPSERSLASSLRVSRLTVREALRILQGEGLIVIRRGSTGGAIVAAKKLTAEQRLRQLVESEEQLREAQEVRRGLEPMGARLAAQRATAEQLGRLDFCQNELLDSTDVSSFRRADSAFHLTIAHASGNALLAAGVREARSSLFVVLDAQEFGVLKSSSFAAHAEILCAITDKDSEEAARLMSKHLEEAWAEIMAVIRRQGLA